jgi:hypothetical protein
MFRLRSVVSLAQPRMLIIRPSRCMQVAGLRTTAARRKQARASDLPVDATPISRSSIPNSRMSNNFEEEEVEEEEDTEPAPRKRSKMPPSVAAKMMNILPVLTNVVTLSKGEKSRHRVKSTFELCDNATKARMINEVINNVDGSEGVVDLMCHRRASSVMRSFVKLASPSDLAKLCGPVAGHVTDVATDRNGNRVLEMIFKHMEDNSQRQSLVTESIASPETLVNVCCDHNGSMIVRQLLEKRKDANGYKEFCGKFAEMIVAHLAELLPNKNGHYVVMSALKHLHNEERDAIVKQMLTFTVAQGYLRTPLSLYAKQEHASRVIRYVIEHGSLAEAAAMRAAVDEMTPVAGAMNEPEV